MRVDDWCRLTAQPHPNHTLHQHQPFPKHDVTLISPREPLFAYTPKLLCPLSNAFWADPGDPSGSCFSHSNFHKSQKFAWRVCVCVPRHVHVQIGSFCQPTSLCGSLDELPRFHCFEICLAAFEFVSFPFFALAEKTRKNGWGTNRFDGSPARFSFSSLHREKGAWFSIDALRMVINLRLAELLELCLWSFWFYKTLGSRL